MLAKAKEEQCCLCTLTEWEAVTVNAEKNTAQLIIPLEDLAPDDRNVTYFGLVAVSANDEKSADYQQSLTMKVDFMRATSSPPRTSHSAPTNIVSLIGVRVMLPKAFAS